MPEIVVDGETGLLAPPDDAAALERALGRLAAQPELRREMGARGRGRAESRFDARRNVGRLHGWMTQAAVAPAALRVAVPAGGSA